MSVLTDLVECWEFNEVTGNAVGAHAGITLTANNNPGSATGKVGNCRDFEFSSSQYFSAADSATLSLGSDTNFMLCAWVKLESKVTGASNPLVGKYLSTGNQRGFHLDFDFTSDRFRLLNSQNGTNVTVVSANNLGSPSLATWYYLCGWHDPVANTVNIQANNGTVDSVAHSTGTFDSSALFMVGGVDFGTLQYHDGLIDQVLFYKGSFPDADTRTWLYNSGNGRSYADMVAAVSPTAALTGNLSNVTVGTVIGSTPSEATSTLDGVSCTASVGNVVGVNILPVTIGEYRHVAAGPIVQRRPMRLKDLERIYKQMERK